MWLSPHLRAAAEKMEMLIDAVRDLPEYKWGPLFVSFWLAEGEEKKNQGSSRVRWQGGWHHCLSFICSCLNKTTKTSLTDWCILVQFKLHSHWPCNSQYSVNTVLFYCHLPHWTTPEWRLPLLYAWSLIAVMKAVPVTTCCTIYICCTYKDNTGRGI